MTPDDALDDDEYFVRPQYRTKKKSESDAPPAEIPTDRLKLLRQLAANPAQSFSVRSDARRLIELADILAPRAFAQRFNDLMAQRDDTHA